jgi:nitrilase
MTEQMKTVKAAVVQTSPVFLNREETVKKACALIEEAGSNGADLVVFPEAFISGYPDWVWVIPNSRGAELNELYTELVNNSVSVPDESTKALCDAAKKANVYAAIGINERNTGASGGSLFNSLLFIDNEGNIAGVHRKLIPTGGERTVWAQGDGSTLLVFDTSIGKIGGLICWENYMPLARQAMYELGTQILLSLTWDKSDNWLASLRHVAREGGVFVISSCSAVRMDDLPDRFSFKKLYPEGREWINPGNSCVINPNGDYIAGPLNSKQEILYADLDLSEIIPAKRMFDAAGHYSRPDVFNFSVSKEK